MDGSTHICGVNKTLVNSFTILEMYPSPEIDLYATLAGDQTFTETDLSPTYSQTEPYDNSQACTTIATHIELIQFTRLPFGIIQLQEGFNKLSTTLLKM